MDPETIRAIFSYLPPQAIIGSITIIGGIMTIGYKFGKRLFRMTIGNDGIPTDAIVEDTEE